MGCVDTARPRPLQCLGSQELQRVRPRICAGIDALITLTNSCLQHSAQTQSLIMRAPEPAVILQVPDTGTAAQSGEETSNVHEDLPVAMLDVDVDVEGTRQLAVRGLVRDAMVRYDDFCMRINADVRPI